MIAKVCYTCNCLDEQSTGRFAFLNAVESQSIIVGKAPSVCGLTSRCSSRQRRQVYGGRFFMAKNNRTRYIDQMGYVVVKDSDHPNSSANGWIREHRLIASQMTGRPLRKDEAVHHIDGNKTNNLPSNLMIVSRSKHIRLHYGNPNHRQENEPNILIPCTCGCGQMLWKYDNRGRPRRSIHGHARRLVGKLL